MPKCVECGTSLPLVDSRALYRDGKRICRNCADALSPESSLQSCSCGRTNAHLHYSSSHDFFIRFGLVCYLLAETVAFVKGYIIGSTVLYLSGDELRAYDAVTRATAQLTAPYEGLGMLVAVLELGMLIIAVGAVLTLRTRRWRDFHLPLIMGVIAMFGLHWFMATRHSETVQAGLLGMPTLVDAQTLQIASQVDAKFHQAYGFWGTPAPDLINLLFSFVTLALFVGALATPRIISERPSTVTPAVPTRMPVRPQTGEAAPPTMFCRHCGAKIPRDSVYCQECGAKLGDAA